MPKRCLILGITGQDGAYLAKHMLSQGYEVWGSSRDIEAAPLANLRQLGVADGCRLISISPVDYHSVVAGLRDAEPDEIYHLASQSSVALSFSQPIDAIEGTVMGALNVLEAVRSSRPETRLYYASSSECFGEYERPIDESTAFHPKSPYAVGKAAASHAVRVYREAYGLFCVNGFLFNHESPLRPERFVTQKIVRGARAIAHGGEQKLVLGNLSIVRDWGWAPEFVEAMSLMLKQERPEDYVIATGESHSLEEFVGEAFAYFGLSYQDHVISDPSLFRPNELRRNQGDPGKAARDLGWRAKFKMPEVVRSMCAALDEAGRE